MRTASQSQLYVVQATAGLRSPKLSNEQGEPATNTSAHSAETSTGAGKSTKTIFSRWFQSLGSIASTASYSDSTAGLKGCRSSASSATGLRQRGRTVQDGNTLKQRLKSLLEKDKRNQAAKLIEDEAKKLGEDNFVYGQEAKFLADIDLDKLQGFVDRVKKIRSDLETEYHFATLDLGEKDEQENSGTTE